MRAAVAAAARRSRGAVMRRDAASHLSGHAHLMATGSCDNDNLAVAEGGRGAKFTVFVREVYCFCARSLLFCAMCDSKQRSKQQLVTHLKP